MTRPDVHLLEKAKAANSSYTAAAMEMRRQTLCLTNSLNYTHTHVFPSMFGFGQKVKT